MKSILLLLTGVGLIAFAGCSTSSPTSPASGESGSVAFKLDKTTIPQGVVTVEAILTRSGYDSLSTSVDVQTDTSATLQMSGIPVGQWHLTVNAMDGSGNILYTGEVDVTITAGTTTQLSLTLQPVGQGTGSVLITVNWGNGNLYFTDYPGNPVLTPSQNPSSPNGVIASRVIIENGKFKMWYEGLYNNGVGNIWSAESDSGFAWSTVGDTPALQKGPDSSWDSYGIGIGTVIDFSGAYYMYYAGEAGYYYGSEESTGLATSTDGITWTKHGAPVLAATGGNYAKVVINSVINVNGVLYGYYNSQPLDGSTSAINLATSKDGVTWENYSGNPILTATLSWEGSGVGGPSVVKTDNGFFMLYQSGQGYKIGMATSSDGIHWIKTSNYVFSSAQTTGGQFNPRYPFLVENGNNEYLLYYTTTMPDGSDVIRLAEYSGSLP